MLIFGKGLKIAFWDVGQTQRYEGVIRFKSHLYEDAYVVNIFDFEKVTEKQCTVHEDQVTHVLLRNVFGNTVWVKIDDLYKIFPSGITIRPDEKYNIDLEFSTVVLPKVSLSPIRYQQLSKESLNYLNYMMRDELFEDTFKQFLKEVKTMNFLSFEVEHSSIWDSDMMRCRLEFEIDSKEAWKYEPLMKRARDSLQIRQFGESVLSAFLDAANLPKPKKVIFHGPATIVMWQDGTKTVVKKTENDTDDREKAVMFAILKKVCGSRGNMNRYLKLFKEVESNEEKKEEAGSSELCQCEQGAGEGSSEGTV